MFAKANLPYAVFEELDDSQSLGHYIFKLCWEIVFKNWSKSEVCPVFSFTFQNRHTFHLGDLFPLI